MPLTDSLTMNIHLPQLHRLVIRLLGSILTVLLYFISRVPSDSFQLRCRRSGKSVSSSSFCSTFPQYKEKRSSSTDSQGCFRWDMHITGGTFGFNVSVNNSCLMYLRAVVTSGVFPTNDQSVQHCVCSTVQLLVCLLASSCKYHAWGPRYAQIVEPKRVVLVLSRCGQATSYLHSPAFEHNYG